LSTLSSGALEQAARCPGLFGGLVCDYNLSLLENGPVSVEPTQRLPWTVLECGQQSWPKMSPSAAEKVEVLYRSYCWTSTQHVVSNKLVPKRRA
jgi:hypothetical protein